MPRVDYVFLHNHPFFDSVYLVELSKRANTQILDLQLFKEYVVTPEKHMIPLLKVLKMPSIFQECDRLMILTKLCDMARSNDVFHQKESYFLLAIDITIRNRLVSKIRKEKTKMLRSGYTLLSTMIETLTKKRIDRYKSSNKMFNLKAELSRSINEADHLYLESYKL